jgi:TolA-binding protein
MKTTYALFDGLAILLASCGGSGASEEQQVKKEKDELAFRIDSLENVLFGQSTNVDREVAAQLLQSYIKFIDTYPADSRCPDFLYKGAGIARGVGVHMRALKMYQQILSDYPEFPKQAETQFLIAFTYDNDIKDIESAKIAYQDVMERYPDHEFAKQAEERLKTIDMSDEELIELFMQRNAESTVQ